MEQITAREAVLQSNDSEINKEELRSQVIITIKNRMKGKTMFVLSEPLEDEKGRKVIGVDAIRVYNPGRNNSYKVEELALLDAIDLLNQITK